MSRNRRLVLVDAVRGIFGIPRLCRCDWQPPDYTRPPHRRTWTLPAADPRCVIHGTPDAQTGAAA